MISGIYADYLRHLGVEGRGSPSAEGLFDLQQAHLEHVPYENIGIQVGRPPCIEPELSALRFTLGRGGYCFHLNGGFAALLDHLGYDVTRHYGDVHVVPSETVNGHHLALTVRVDGREYLVDVGLGDGPLLPLPLREGTYEQLGFTYRLERTSGPAAGRSAGWVLHHDARGSFERMVFHSAPAQMTDFDTPHYRLTTGEDSPFVRTFAMMRRHRGGTDALRGRVLTRIRPDGNEKHEITTEREWFEVFGSVFGRSLVGLTPDDLSGLWQRVCRAHDAWLAARAAAMAGRRVVGAR
ncbi:arylamine N-acetyltransferase family protein [Streptomyces sp. NPDC002073]|uniref:arylamine N-acetyltransferase family protein n=1 Tax=Streptomyces sp. NBC_00239 TaxID=2903640 RepID=UPI002E2A6CCD|nr:arylamine N-acetyltransferase [Streptomyces sp. NBC_00239]